MKKLILSQYTDYIMKYNYEYINISIFLEEENKFISYQESELVDNYKDYNHIKNFIIKYYKNKNKKIIIKSHYGNNIINSELHMYILNNEIYIKSIYMVLNLDNYDLISNIKKYKIYFKYICVEQQFNELSFPFKLQYIEISNDKLELINDNFVNKINIFNRIFNRNCNKYGLDYLKFGISLYDSQIFVYELKDLFPSSTINVINNFSKLIKEYNKYFKKHNDYKIYGNILKIYYGNNSQEREVQFLIEFNLLQENYLILNTIKNFESKSFFPTHEYIKKNINNIFDLAHLIDDNYKIDNTKLLTFYKLLIILMKEKKRVFNNPILWNNKIKILPHSKIIRKLINKFNLTINIIYNFNKYNYNKFQFLNLIYSEELENEIQKALYDNE